MVNEKIGKHKRKIIECLDKFGRLGTSELEKCAQLHRETVLILCKQLVNEGWIYDKENKHGKYRLKKKSDFHYPSHSNIRRKLYSRFDKFPLVTEEKNDLFNIDEKRLLKDLDYFIKYTIFEYSNRMGALLTYLIIEALRPKGLVPTLDNIPINFKNSKYEFLGGRDRDKIAKEFIDTIFDPNFLIEQFSKPRFIRTGLKINNPINENINKIIKNLKQEETKAIKEKNTAAMKEISRRIKEMRKIKEMEMNPKDPYWSLYELDQETYNKLKQIYSNIYPRFYEELEKIKNEVSKHT